MVLGTLLLFAVLVVVIHALAVGHATEPLRLEGLRVAADAAARDLAAGRAPLLAEPFGFAVVDRTGELRAGRAPAWKWRFGELHAPQGERCAPRGSPCWAVRALDDGARLVVYPRLLGSSSLLGRVSLAFFGTVVAWVAVSALAGLVLLRSLRRADASRRRLLAGLAHDLGTPLTSIRGFAETQLADDGAAAEPGARRVWTVVYREALRMQRLIEDMLALTRLETGRLAVVPRPFDLRELLEGAAERAAMAYGAAPTLALPDTPARVVADRDRIDQVLGNLVDNAYRHGGGRDVRLALERAMDGRTWNVAVADAGPGLSAEARAHLYEPFRPWGSAKGSGLGLAIAREIVARHGGALRVASGPGCHVSFALPAVAAEAP